MGDPIRYSTIPESNAPQTDSALKAVQPRHQVRRKPVSSNLASAPLITDTEVAESIDDKPEEETQSRPNRPSATAWTPLYLRTWVLTCFLFLFLAMLAALQVLLSISNLHHGIANSQDRLHYLWTYSPTAFLTLVMVFWDRVDYQGQYALNRHKNLPQYSSG